MSRSSRRLLYPFCGLLLASSLAIGQESPGAGDYGERIDVRAVNVEAVVTDRKGNRVSGLTADDFELLVDGKPMPLEFFLEVRGGRAVVPAEGGPALPTSAEAGEPVGHNYLVFIDEVLSPIRERKAAIKKLAGEIERLGPADRMAIVASNTSGIHVLSPWTDSRQQLKAALETARERTGYMRPWERSPEEEVQGQGDLVASAMSEDRAYEYGLKARDFRSMVRAAAEAEREFSDAAGRKVLLLVSGRWVGFFQKADVRTGYEVIRPLTDASNLLGYTVYPVQLDAHIEALPGADRRTLMAPGEVLRTRGLTSFMEGQGPMLFAADETGGQLFKLDHRFLTRTAEDLSSYYWFGFSAFDGDGRRRTVEVRVKDKDLRTRTRSSYLPLSRQADAAPRGGARERG